MNDNVSEIKSRLDLIDLVGRYVKLTAAGGNFRGLCPFHQEKSPSFMVSREKQIWHCFGCGRGGDAFKFVMEAEGLSFVEALKILAQETGVELRNARKGEISKKGRLLEILDISSRYYHNILTHSSLAQKAREYLIGRGLTESGVVFWRIGYSVDSWDDLILELKKRGFSDEEIAKSGMSVKKDGAYRFYNRFRGRIMFPIFDVNGQAVAFTARVSPEKEATEKMGKYINSSETELYSKSKIIFALNFAKQHIKQSDLAVVVEGQMDAITAHENGFINVVASSGTAFTRDQLVLLKRYTSNIAFAFDADAAGEMAAERGIDAAIASGMNVSVIKVPFGKDPDECIRRNPDDWNKAVSERKNANEYFFDKVFSKEGAISVEHKKQAVAKLSPKIAQIANKIEQDFWIKRMSEEIGANEEIIREEIIKITPQNRNDAVGKNAPSGNNDNQTARGDKISRLILSMLLKYPFLRETGLNRIIVNAFGDEEKNLYNSLVAYYTTVSGQSSDGFLFEEFRRYLEEIGEYEKNAGLLGEIAFSGEEIYEKFSQEEILAEFISVVAQFNKNYFFEQKKIKERELLQAEASHNDARANEIMNDLQRLNKEASLLN